VEAREPTVIEGHVHMFMYSLDQHDRTLYVADVEMDDNEGTLEEVLQGYQGQRVRIIIEVINKANEGKENSHDGDRDRSLG
jgi:hypothetical protein